MANTAALTGTIEVLSTSNSSHIITITITVSDDRGAIIATTSAPVSIFRGSGVGDYIVFGLPAASATSSS